MSPRTVMGCTVPKEMEPTIEKAEREGMERLGWTRLEAYKDPDPRYTDKVPSWIEIPDRFDLSGSRGEYTILNGDTFVYMLISNGAAKAMVYRQLKSDYYETTSKKGTCPNCQAYVKRYEDDDYLTCHRCGWQYKTLKDRLKTLL